ncbi:DTW domain-containing protein 1 [Bulinus truncatus]|nr:DTW domain-containing protein 1 [Bulinus truncatus]
MESNPFPDAVIADWTPLDQSDSRSHCPKCRKSRKYYCYSCFIPLPHINQYLPQVKLPLKVDIIKHPSEIDGKSTAPHAAIIAPTDVTIYTYPCIPDYDIEKVVLVFPCDESLTLEEVAGTSRKNQPVSTNSKPVLLKESQSNPNSVADDVYSDVANIQAEKIEKEKYPSDDGEINEDKNLPFNRVVFVDSTWNQTNNIITDERLKNLKKVELHSRNTHFWRSQEGIPKSYLSTIEAIYYFVVDFHRIFINSDYNHEYDNLLFFFCFMYEKIRKSSGSGKRLKAYQR